MDADEDARLVETGAFRVDAKRAFEVLRERQLPGDYWRPGLWVRCAAACGARRLTFERGARSLTIRFDGAPLPAEALENPFGLLAEGGDEPARRWFGWAVLHTLAKGVTLTASSGAGDARRAVVCTADGSVQACPPDGEGTHVAVRWGLLDSPEPGTPHPSFWRLGREPMSPPSSYRADPAPFLLSVPGYDGTEEHRPWERRPDPHAVLVRAQGRRIRAVFGASTPRLRYSLLGVLADREDGLERFPIPASVTVDDPGLDLDASLTAPVEGPAFAAARNAALAGAREGARRLLARHARSMPLIGRLLLKDPVFRLLWVKAMGLSRPGEMLGHEAAKLQLLLGSKARSPHRRRIEEGAGLTKLLRHAAAEALKTPADDALDPLLDGLWRVPLFFGPDGAARSLKDLDAPQGLPDSWDAFDPPARACPQSLWALSPLDKVYLKKTFPSRPRARR